MIKKLLVQMFCSCLISFPVLALDTATAPTEKNQKPFFDFDISGSAGTYNGKGYTELHMGLNLNFTDWLTWRNSAFKRITSGSNQESTGLDSSLRMIYETTGINFYAGPGYRWMQNSDQNAALAEVGMNIKVAALTLGAGVKYLLYDKAQYDPVTKAETKRDDANYFITFSGGTGWTF